MIDRYPMLGSILDQAMAQMEDSEIKQLEHEMDILTVDQSTSVLMMFAQTIRNVGGSIEADVVYNAAEISVQESYKNIGVQPLDEWLEANSESSM